ncbi:hypothetical protein [Haloferax sp. DFSO52]|uniref:hypothetical protein n=1 Tax=Haloferax sp. DFSO52 TaxID=3388505 RepID=UPI003A85351B
MAKNSLSDLGSEWFSDILAVVTGWFQQGIETGYTQLTAATFGTPTPTTDSALGVGTPVNEPWVSLHQTLVGGETTFLALLVLVIAVQARTTIRVFNVGSPLTARATKRSAWIGAAFIVLWYWIAATSLTLVNGLTIALLPPVDTVGTLIDDLLVVTIANPILAFGLGFIGALGMWVLHALFIIRDLLIYGYVYAMPFGLAVAYANIPIASGLASSLCRRFIPLLVFPLPVALLFGAYELVLTSALDVGLLPTAAFARYLVAVSLPVLSVFIVWRLFTDVAPKTTRVVRRGAGVAATVGTVVGAGAVGGPAGATTVAKVGARSAAIRTVETRLGGADSNANQSTTSHDNIASDAHGQRGIPSYRRTENDPGYY